MKEMPNEFLNICKENNVQITVTYYNLKNIDLIMRELSVKHNIKIDYFSGRPNKIGEKKYFNKYAMDLSGSQDYVENYNNCGCIINWKCMQISGTKLYCCPIGSYIKLFNNKFGTDIVDEEYLDLTKVDNYFEIEEWFYIPKKICRYCDKSKLTKHEWKPSKKEISEWV